MAFLSNPARGVFARDGSVNSDRFDNQLALLDAQRQAAGRKSYFRAFDLQPYDFAPVFTMGYFKKCGRELRPGKAGPVLSAEFPGHVPVGTAGRQWDQFRDPHQPGHDPGSPGPAQRLPGRLPARAGRQQPFLAHGLPGRVELFPAHGKPPEPVPGLFPGPRAHGPGFRGHGPQQQPDPGKPLARPGMGPAHGEHRAQDHPRASRRQAGGRRRRADLDLPGRCRGPGQGLWAGQRMLPAENRAPQSR